MAAANHLAEFNVVRMRGPLDGPVMHGFTSRLAEVNALAERSPGFVWRLQTDEGDATAIRPFDDDQMLINLSVWESIDALREYVFRGAHGEMVRGGDAWFDRGTALQVVLWWIPIGQPPTLEEAIEKLEKLRSNGPSPAAFDFQTTFPSNG